MVEQMKGRLKDTLEEKKEFEIEFLQLQKNFLKLKAENKAFKENAPSPDELERLRAEVNRLKQNQGSSKDDEEAKMLKQDKQLLQRQNNQLSDAYRDQAQRYDRDDGLNKLTDDYIDSYKKQIENLNETLDVKDNQTAEYLSKLGQLKDYSSQLKSELERLYGKEGKVMDQSLQNAPTALNTDN